MVNVINNQVNIWKINRYIGCDYIKRIVLITGILLLSVTSVCSSNFSLENWYNQQASKSMSEVIDKTKIGLNRSLSDYSKFTIYLQLEGSRELTDQTDFILSTASTNINKHSTEYSAEINSTTNELKTSRYNQLVNEKISENNEELEAEVTEMIEEILSN